MPYRQKMAAKVGFLKQIFTFLQMLRDLSPEDKSAEEPWRVRIYDALILD